MNPFAMFASLFLLFSLSAEAATRYIDLSHQYDDDTIAWPGEEEYKMVILHNGTAESGYWYQKEKISTATHCGTHLDAPCHFSEGKLSVEQIPINRLITSAVMVDVSQKTSGNSDYEVTTEDLKEWESEHGKIPQGAVLLIRTGWAQYWPDKTKYLGADTNDTSLLHFPGVSPEAAQWIATQRNISGLGIDTPSIDHGQTTELKTHQILAAENIYNLENIGEMGELSATGIMLYVMPMKLRGASGAPCRVIAAVSDDAGCNVAKTLSHSFHLTIAVIIFCCFKDVYRNVL